VKAREAALRNDDIDDRILH
jgi:hypothetical protein